MIKRFLGPGLQGLLFVTFLAAFMSTITTHLNWGASYIVNDIYKRFINKSSSDRHYVLISRIFTIVITVLAGAVAFFLKDIGKAWIFLWAMSAGIGLVLILRWFWWRINVWSEISALSSSIITIVVIIIYTKLNSINLELKHQVLVIPVSIITWITVTFLTNPEPNETLNKFYDRVRPWGFWKPFQKTKKDNPESFKSIMINWLLGVCIVLFGMLGTGKFILGFYSTGIVMISISFISLILLLIKYYRSSF